MLHGIALPPYELVRKYEGKGNYAIKKYYQFPFNIVYKKKLRMIIDMLTTGKIYRNILDYGCGPAEIFRKELQKHTMALKCYDSLPFFDSRWKFDVIICASVLEFVHLPTMIEKLRKITAPTGMIIVASPMKSWISRLYFKLINDPHIRHDKAEIIAALEKHFRVIETKTWLGIYFACKGVPK